MTELSQWYNWCLSPSVLLISRAPSWGFLGYSALVTQLINKLFAWKRETHRHMGWLARFQIRNGTDEVWAECPIRFNNLPSCPLSALFQTCLLPVIAFVKITVKAEDIPLLSYLDTNILIWENWVRKWFWFQWWMSFSSPHIFCFNTARISGF